MRAGSMTEIITFEQKSVTRGDAGGEAISWTEFAKVWARAKPATGGLKTAADQPHAETDVAFYIRYRADITPALRLVWNGVPHEIASVFRVEGRKGEVEILAHAGVKFGG